MSAQPEPAGFTELRAALEASVKLQSHYARLLNMYDTGLRLEFANADEWIERLRFLKLDRQRPAR